MTGRLRTPSKSTDTLFRSVAIATLLFALAQVTLGGVVRATGSGLGCPDWPLCHGQLIPPFQTDTLIEYSHRLVASTLGLMMFAATAIVWLYYRRNAWMLRSAVAGLALVAAAALLGGATVLTELEWWLRLIHLALAEALVTSLALLLISGWRETSSAVPAKAGRRETSSGVAMEMASVIPAKAGTRNLRLNALIIATFAGVFLLMMSGSFMVGLGYGTSCATWPLCRGEYFPQGAAYAIHMGHRQLSVVVGLMLLALAALAYVRGRDWPALRWAAASTAALFLAQILVGAWIVWAQFSAELKAAHLSMATLTWFALSFLCALAYTRKGAGLLDAPAGTSPDEQSVMGS